MSAVSARILGNASLDRFDALVIGSGASGGAVAAMLTGHGQKVLVLEAGSNYFPDIDRPAAATALGSVGQALPLFGNDELKLLHRYQIEPDPLAEPRTLRHTIADGDRLRVGDIANFAKTVGGGATHADLKTPRFIPDDFRLGTLLGAAATAGGASFVDWPVQYDALEPFYLHTERLMGVQGIDGVDPNAGPRSGPYPMPPGAAMYVAPRAQVGLAKLGYTLFPCPTAINSVPYDGRPACNDCGFCQSSPCVINAKGTPGVTTLRKALLSGNCQLRPETRAVRLVVDGAGTTVTGVEAILPDGSRAMFTADRYFLAANPVEDVRLLALSGGGRPLGNSSGLVGRNLMLHHGVNVLGVFEDQLHGHRGRGSTHAFTDFRVPSNRSQPIGGIVVVTTVPYLIQQAQTYLAQFGQLGVQGALFKKFLRQARPRDRLLSLNMYGEDAPQPANTVDLDPAVRDIDGIPVARLTYQPHDYELAAEKFYVPRMIDIVGAAGARFGVQAPNGDPPSAGHLMGTLRFGSDPASSVCRPDGRFHDIGNLYGTGASLFPTSSGFNPTLTITMLATYVAASALFPGAPERALG
jgi:choline dehydrogenase-like flavoprotein